MYCNIKKKHVSHRIFLFLFFTLHLYFSINNTIFYIIYNTIIYNNTISLLIILQIVNMIILNYIQVFKNI